MILFGIILDPVSYSSNNDILYKIVFVIFFRKLVFRNDLYKHFTPKIFKKCLVSFHLFLTPLSQKLQKILYREL